LNNILTNFALNSTTEIVNTSFIFSIILSFTLSFILSRIYISQSNSISNPQTLGRIFPILSIGTTIIITIVKSSLALSLGLVGALSIVRFRTPIKEPEELTYIFLCIGIGLATGADQYQAALIGFILTTLCIYLNKLITKKENSKNRVRISIYGIGTSDITKLIELISKNCNRVQFHNLSKGNNEDDNKTNITLSIVPKDFNQLDILVNEISHSYPSCALNIVDNNNNNY